LKTTATIGALGMERLGDTAFNVVLIGQNLSARTLRSRRRAETMSRALLRD
jgi:hypothetical protein